MAPGSSSQGTLDEHEGSTEQFRLALEAAPTGMLMVDREGRIVMVNLQIEKLFGYAREELIGRPIELLVPERFRGRHPAARAIFSADPKTRPMGAGRDLFGLRRDGTEIPIEIGLNPLRTSAGEFVLSSVADVTERKRAERERERLMGELQTLNAELEARVEIRTRELNAALDEREVLLQEVHHRVKNNLQIISSLINMQIRKLLPGTSKHALEECQTRVLAIALIHEKLYHSHDYSKIACVDYVHSLVRHVLQATGAAASAVKLELAIENLSLAVDKAIPCGLLLNELITNALKHGFPEPRSGGHEATIRVELERLGAGRIRLRVCDNGVGLPRGFGIESADSMGLQLVRTLAQQLKAELVVRSENGAEFELTFAVEEAK